MKMMIRLVASGQTGWRLRFLAFLNLTGCLYFVVMSLCAAWLVWCEILPYFYENRKLILNLHKMLILYVSVNAFGNFFLCVSINNGVRRLDGRELCKSETKQSKTNKNVLTRKPSKEELFVDNQVRLSERSQTRKIKFSKIRSSKNKPSKSETGEIMSSKNKPSKSETGESESKENERTRKPRKGVLCVDCRAVKPNRSHHCPLCRTCILKRDHHCFFMTVCIGYYTQKHFIFYCLFMFVGTFYTLIMVVKYASALYGLRFAGPQTFVTLLVDTVVLCVSTRPPSLFYLCLILLLYCSLVMGLVSVVFLYWQITIATSGQTTYEAWRGLGTYYQKSITHNLRDVFGKFWLLLFFIPLPLPQYGDGTYEPF